MFVKGAVGQIEDKFNTKSQAFQRPMKEGVKLLHVVQDVFLTKEVTIA